MATRILLLDEPATTAELQRLALSLGHDGLIASDATDAVSKLRNESFDLCLADVGRPEAETLALIEAARTRKPAVPVVALNGEASVKKTVGALRAGAVDFLSKPFHRELFAETLGRALGTPGTAGGQDQDLRRTTDATDVASLVGEHPAVRLMLERIDHVARTDANILIRGEAGTGKQMPARLVHAASARRGGPFLSVELGHLPPAVAEATLCGDAGGKRGKLLEAHGGTIFLDEVGAMPRALQHRLLRVLQDGVLIPDGGGAPTPVNVRVIAASSRNLEQMVRQGSLLDDLYYRLDVIPLEVPALRERREDIPLLAEHFCREVNARASLSVPGLSPEVMKRLASYDWPGNIRQLQATVELLVRQAGDREVTLNDLPTNLRADVVDLGVGTLDLPPFGVDLRLLLTRLEDRLIGQALERTGGNKNRAAELLGMNRTTLVEKLRRRNVA
jgi:DNA-binding NtrC family response regulator